MPLRLILSTLRADGRVVIPLPAIGEIAELKDTSPDLAMPQFEITIRRSHGGPVLTSPIYDATNAAAELLRLCGSRAVLAALKGNEP